MSDFYAQICFNGHVLIKHHPLSCTEFCEVCGSKMLSRCPNCNSSIREWHYNGITVLSVPKYERPLYCKSCGKPYPWTTAAIEAATVLIQEDEQLSELQRNNLQQSLPDIISETPRTKIASVRIKKALLTAGKFTSDALREFVIDFGCELAKKSLGL